ncbi:restriction endonuclease subunit S [Methylobacterium sp. Leaf456]|uniref:restriction endonuclease subunit S n=1 Tax=Methylobacterium sp. Leaf456 TaxID=1736382 RepID=UPI0009E8FF88|nr:restriction endonuclease subunit S [Methylobacterium sp. Leaf456]
MTEVPSGWVLTEIGKVARIETGRTPSRQDAKFSGYMIPFFKPGDLDKEVCISSAEEYVSEIEAQTGRILPPNTLLISCIGNLGKVALTSVDSICNQQINAILPTPIFETKFLFYWSLTIKDWMEANSSATTIRIINKGRFSVAPILVPPLVEQSRIVAKINSLSAKSKRARDHLDHVPKLISQYKRAVLAKFFGMQWNGEKFVHTFPVRELSSIADIQSGIALGKKRSIGQKLVSRPYLRVANVQRGWIAVDDIKYTDVTLEEAHRLMLLPGDILMNEGGDRDKLGRGWVWSGEVSNCIHQNHVFRVRLNEKKFPSRFISYFANEFGRFHFFAEGKQTTNLASISKSNLSTLLVPLPTVEEAVCIMARIETTFSMIDRLAAEAASARKLIDHLDQAVLSKAFRGELVPQDPNDEPASVLLERIEIGRAGTTSQSRRRGRPKAVPA